MPNLSNEYLSIAVSDILLLDEGTNLIHDTEQRYEVLILLLRDELGDDADVLERALSVGDAHDAVHEVDQAEPAGMVVA